MKTSKLLAAAMAFIIPSALLFTGCNLSFFNTINYKYDDADKYTAGDREITEKVTSINIDYLSGDVVLNGNDTDKVTVKETANKNMTEDQMVHTWVNDGTLYVRYCASKNGISVDKLEKSLEITVPGAQDLNDLIVHLSSGNFNCSGITTDNAKGQISSGNFGMKCSASDVELKATSGNIVLTLDGDSSLTDLDTSSGNISFTQSGNINSVKMHASSGNVAADLEKVGTMDIRVSSGNINIEADEIGELNSSSSSGTNEFVLGNAPSKSDIRSSSGSVKVYLPEDADVTVNTSISSGEFNYDLAFAKTGKTYVCGNGTSTMDIHVSSGDVSVLKH